ncbi:MAG: rhomboid family intramembrane serine protease [Kineothrix sp.]
MNNFGSNLERKFGRYAIKNISLVLIMCYAAGYLIYQVNPRFLLYLTLNPYEILRGQVWRIFTWIIVPPDMSNLLFVLLMLYFYYSIGTSLERVWGTWRYNIYLLSGMLFTVIGSFLLLGYCYLFQGDLIAYIGAVDYFGSISMYFSTYYINMSIFLAFAATFPEAQVLLMFIIPVKVKWLGVIYGIMLLAEFWQGDVYSRFALAASLLNFVVFFLTSRRRIHMSPRQVKRQQEFRREVKRSSSITKHKCAVCGRTEADSPELEFRFCSKCDGNYEYCQDHLFTHQHIRSN